MSQELAHRRPQSVADLPERFWAKVEFGPGCWPWTGAKTPRGYGSFSLHGKTEYSHRLVYTVAVGPLVPPMQVDHLCRNRACLRPSHLDGVTSRENTLRGEGIPAVNSRKTTCKNGHALNEANTYIRPDRTGRNCRPCQLERNRRAVARKRASNE